MTKHILVLHTGGTISMTETRDGDIMPSQHNPLLGADSFVPAGVELTNEEIFNLPSPHMTPERMLTLVKRIRRAEKEGADGVVVTHGTDTLEETAYFLDLTLDSAMPVVVTGAMRSSNEIGSDGLENLQSAINTAASDESRNKGTLVVTKRAVWISSFMTTKVPLFRDSSLAAVLIALWRFSRPSLPISLLDRMAPVTTTGIAESRVRSRK